jgi:hypothetical protein
MKSPPAEAEREQQDADSEMMKTYFLDVKADERPLNRFEVRFALDGEAIQHAKQLAASLRRRHFNNHPGLMIEVIDPSRKIHEEIIYPEGEQK